MFFSLIYYFYSWQRRYRAHEICRESRRQKTLRYDTGINKTRDRQHCSESEESSRMFIDKTRAINFNQNGELIKPRSSIQQMIKLVCSEQRNKFSRFSPRRRTTAPPASRYSFGRAACYVFLLATSPCSDSGRWPRSGA